MKRGHVVGTKKERKVRQGTVAKLEAMGAAIAAQFAGRTKEEMVQMISGK
jgi:hypothetical protein